MAYPASQEGPETMALASNSNLLQFTRLIDSFAAARAAVHHQEVGRGHLMTSRLLTQNNQRKVDVHATKNARIAIDLSN
jgi:hypothetical protein